MFITITEWIEVQRWTWTCQGCTRQCQVFSYDKPKSEECDHSKERINEITGEFGGDIRGGA